MATQEKDALSVLRVGLRERRRIRRTTRPVDAVVAVSPADAALRYVLRERGYVRCDQTPASHAIAVRAFKHRWQIIIRQFNSKTMAAASTRAMLLMENNLLKLRLLRKLKKMHDYRKQTHRIYRNRLVYGEFHHLYLELRADEITFREYTRMTINTFDYIVEKIRGACYHCTTNFQRPISVEERLSVFLATASHSLSTINRSLYRGSFLFHNTLLLCTSEISNSMAVVVRELR